MNLDKFMVDYFKSNDTVIVNANELQELIRNRRAKDVEMQKLSDMVNNYRNSLNLCKEKCNALELNKPMYIDLKV